MSCVQSKTSRSSCTASSAAPTASHLTLTQSTPQPVHQLTTYIARQKPAIILEQHAPATFQSACRLLWPPASLQVLQNFIKAGTVRTARDAKAVDLDGLLVALEIDKTWFESLRRIPKTSGSRALVPVLEVLENKIREKIVREVKKDEETEKKKKGREDEKVQGKKEERGKENGKRYEDKNLDFDDSGFHQPEQSPLVLGKQKERVSAQRHS